MNQPVVTILEHVEFIEYFKDLDDPRQENKITYPLDEILFLVLCAVLCGANSSSYTTNWRFANRI